MGHQEYYYRWEWQLEASPTELWPLVADTNRFNRDTGYPNVKKLDNNGNKLENAYRRLRLTRFGVPIEWLEEPFEWIRPYSYGVVRHYSKGPILEMRTLTELHPLPTGGTQLVYKVWATPRNLLGYFAIPAQVQVLSQIAFNKTLKQYNQLAVKGQTQYELPSNVEFAAGGRERLANLQSKLLEQGANPEIVGRLSHLVEKADDILVNRIRPYALADRWGLPRRAVLETCLWATRIGLLDFRWDLLCPLCRGASDSSPNLNGIQRQVHCDSCNIDFSANFDKSVELTFRPNLAVRKAEVGEFCVGGPQLTPHIMAQQLLAPGTTRQIQLPLEPGRYRLRTLKLQGGQFLQVSPSGSATATLRAETIGWSQDELTLNTNPTLNFENNTSSDQLFVLEHMVWSDQATTAAEVTALQLFRDLFANEALRPGEQISVGTLAVLFTDLRGSTRLYREIGDAPAFGRVMNHFDILKRAISEEEGALVKTIGDTVMAVFLQPAGAVRAMLKAQEMLAAEGQPPLCLKAGIHYGPCIAVNLNDRLDYFGSTINLAARLEGFSTGDDVVISAAVRNDPEVIKMLTDPQSQFKAEPFEANLKGFDEERFNLWRVVKGSSILERSELKPVVALG